MESQVDTKITGVLNRIVWDKKGSTWRLFIQQLVLNGSENTGHLIMSGVVQAAHIPVSFKL